MKSFKELYTEEPLTPDLTDKNKWIGIPSGKLINFSDDMIGLVQKAYEKTPEGSFVNSVNDVKQSKWQAIDIDRDPDSDAVIFYRKPRSNENFKSNKIQGIGHDGSREAITIVLNKLVVLLNGKGWWVEASGALEHILYKKNVKYINDEAVLKRVFPNATFIDDRGKYKRAIKNKTIIETMFGNPF
jgi:hypothetical protein